MNANKIVENRIFTLLYRSPESINLNYLDYSIDYWSFGVCVYLMLTGSFPFDSKEINDIHHIIPDPNEKRLIKVNSIDWKQLENGKIKPPIKPCHSLVNKSKK